MMNQLIKRTLTVGIIASVCFAARAEEKSALDKMRDDLARKTKNNDTQVERRDKKPQKSNILERSTVLAFNGKWTFVPKGAILHTPAKYADRMPKQAPAGSKYLTWLQFQTANRNWIKSQPFNMPQLRGQEEIPDRLLELARKSGLVTIATYSGSPVSLPEIPTILEK